MISESGHSRGFDVHSLAGTLNYMHFAGSSSVLSLLKIKNTYTPRITQLYVFTS